MRRTRLLASAAGACLLLAMGAATARAADPVIAAAGDIACDPSDANFNSGEGTAEFCRQKHTSDLLVDRSPVAVLALGDTQYSDAAFSKFGLSYDPSWGRVKVITRPALGNHEYRVSPDGYFDYFNGVGEDDGLAGERGLGYYSFDVGSWHLIALNSMCNQVAGGCGASSAQAQWLRADLAANAGATCTLAYWHHPLFNSGPDGNATGRFFDTTAFWQALYDAGGDLVLNGHSHAYERFAAQDPQGNADPQHGLREFVVGTGGHSHGEFDGTPQPNSQLRNRTHFGVLELVLHPNGYDWAFIKEDGQTFDSGSASCHDAPDDTPPQTTIDSGPNGVTTTTSATFAFSSSEAGSAFQCELDGGGWQSCTSPKGYTGIAIGSHTFETRATDAAGNVDPTPAVRSWSVERDAAPAEEPALSESPDSPAGLRSKALRPASYDVRFGQVIAGKSVRRLYRDDGRRLKVAASLKRSGAYVSSFSVLTNVGPNVLASLDGLRLAYDGGSARRARVKVRIFNHRSERWVTVYGPRAGRRDRSFEWAASAFAADYVSANGKIRVRVKGKAARQFRTRTDLVGITVEY